LALVLDKKLECCYMLLIWQLLFACWWYTWNEVLFLHILASHYYTNQNSASYVLLNVQYFLHWSIAHYLLIFTLLYLWRVTCTFLWLVNIKIIYFIKFFFNFFKNLMNNCLLKSKNNKIYKLPLIIKAKNIIVNLEKP